MINVWKFVFSYRKSNSGKFCLPKATYTANAAKSVANTKKCCNEHKMECRVRKEISRAYGTVDVNYCFDLKQKAGANNGKTAEEETNVFRDCCEKLGDYTAVDTSAKIQDFSQKCK